MVGIAVFASLLAVPRLAVSPDRIVMVASSSCSRSSSCSTCWSRWSSASRVPRAHAGRCGDWPGTVAITLAPKKLIRTRRASEGNASEPSLARRVSMCKDAKLSCRGNTTVARHAGDGSSGSDWAPGLMRPAPKTQRGIGSGPRPAPGKDSRPPKISERQPAAGCFRASEPGTCPAS
jgi:hypothetical protein